MWKLRVGPVDDDLILRSGNEVRSAVAAVLVADGKLVRTAQDLSMEAWNMIWNEGEPWVTTLRNGREMKVGAA